MKKATLVIFVFFLFGVNYAQIIPSTSFSSYNIGIIEENTTTFQRISGAGKYGYVNVPFVNLSNPATLSFADNTIFDVGVKSRINNIQQNNQTGQNQMTTLLHGALLFPIIEKKMGLSLSLMPYSRVAYNSTGTYLGPDSIEYKNIHSGIGGINQLRISTGYNFTIDSTFIVGFGLAAQYIFGNIRSNADFYTSATNFLNVYKDNRNFLRGITPELGMILLKKFSNKNQLSLGANYQYKSSINITQEEFMYYYKTNNNAIKDTIVYQLGDRKNNLPQKMGIGVTFSIKEKIVLSADYDIQRWDSSSVNIDQTEVSNRERIGLGILYTPISSERSKFQPMFSANVQQIKHPIIVQGKQLISESVGLGVTIPFTGKYKTKTYVNFGIEIGKFNSVVTNYKENFTNLHLGLVLSPNAYDKWFQRSKID